MRGETGPIKVRPGEAPQHDAFRRWNKSSDNDGGEGGSERAVFLVAARSEDFMQGAACQPAARQHPVDCGEAKGQYAVRRRRRPLDPPNAFAQQRQKIVRHGR